MSERRVGGDADAAAQELVRRAQARADSARAGPGLARRALHLFSGRKGRTDGLAAKLVARGWAVDEVDVGLGTRGAMAIPEDDLHVDGFFIELLSRAMAGYYDAVIIGVPCSTFSVARLRPGGPPTVRQLPGEGRGLINPPLHHEHEAERANELVWRSCAIAEATQASGGVFVIENPIDRSDEETSRRLRLGHWPRHASLWQMEEVVALQAATGALVVHFPQCALGGVAQKWTTLIFSPMLSELSRLGSLRCRHTRDEHRVRGSGRTASGAWTTAALAAYPEEMNGVIAAAVDGAVLAANVGPRPAGMRGQTPQAAPLAPSNGTGLRATLARASEKYSRAVAPAVTPEVRTFAKGERCLHVPADASESMEGRPCEVVAVHTDDVEPYFTVLFDDGGQRETVQARLRSFPVVGSKRPHAALGEAGAATTHSHVAASMSLRNNEAELREVLEDEPLPDVNVPPSTEWFDSTRDARAPSPLSTDELIPAAAQRAVAEHIRRVQACYKRARQGEHGWRVARDMRPEPLVLTEAEAMHPAGRGWCWVQHADGMWHPLTRSSWPDDPPESDLNVGAILDAAKADHARFGPEDVRFPDRFVLACISHGYPAPDLERVVVLGYPHVGALKSMAGLDSCLAKDRKQDDVEGARPWTVHGGTTPQVWPMRADPINVVWRNGKPRITIDKSMELSDLVKAYNTAVDLEAFDPVEMVRVQQLARAAAILLTASAGVRVWSFDFEAYFRKTGKQRADWWKSGYVLPDGFGFDKRVQFGQREAPVLTSRQSNFLVWAMRRETHAFDAACPPREASVLAWRLLRELLAEKHRPASQRVAFGDRWTSLSFIMQYVDDVGAASIDDLLYDATGAPYFMRWSQDHKRRVPCGREAEGAQHARRPDAHFHVAVAVIESFGHTAADGKNILPDLRMDLLGVHIDVAGYRRMLPTDKCEAYGAAIDAVLTAPRSAGGGRVVPYADFNSHVHKLLHASSTVVLGRQHLHHCMAALRAENRLRAKAVLVHEQQDIELRWWREQLLDPTRHCLPLASRVTFPETADTGVVVSYSDAARELDSPHTSGFGAWTVLRGEFYYIAGLWSADELRAFSINVLELAAENMGTFAFAARARELGVEVSHSLDFVDNTAAEYSADRGSPHAPAMRELVRRRFDALDALGIFSSVDRITSVDNEWADALSRGEERVQDVLRIVRALGWLPRRLYPHSAWRDLSGLPRLDA